MSVLHLLEQAADMEHRLSDAYRRLSFLTPDENLRTELQRLAEEEVVHANLIKSAKGYAQRNPELFSSEEITDLKIRGSLLLVAALVADLDKEEVTLPDGLRRISGLEKHCEMLHLDHIVEVHDPSLKNLFQALANGDKSHQERLARVVSGL